MRGVPVSWLTRKPRVLGRSADLSLDPGLCQGYNCELRHGPARGGEECENFQFAAKHSDRGTRANESLGKREPRTRSLLLQIQGLLNSKDLHCYPKVPAAGEKRAP